MSTVSVTAPRATNSGHLHRGRSHHLARLRDRVAAFYDLDRDVASPRQRLPALDGIRGFAALQIIVYHCVLVSGAFRLIGYQTLGAGLFGVDIFFVLSGFVLFLPWGAAHRRGTPPPALKGYYVRRIRRIVPAYYFMLFFLVLFFTPSHIATSAVYSWSGFFAILTHLSFQQAIVMRGLGAWIGWSAQPGFGINGVIWTLTFEVSFYLLLPFLYRFFCGSIGKVVRNACIAALIAIGWAWVRFNIVGLSNRLFGIALVSHKNTAARDRIQDLMANLLPTYAAHFAFGMAAAYLFLRIRDQSAHIQTRWFRACISLAQLDSAIAFVALMAWTASLRT
ncbi:MAG: acyltransferase family protein, partial [Thermomicrobiales bacterium]